MQLRDELCTPAQGVGPTLTSTEVNSFQGELPGREVVNGDHLHPEAITDTHDPEALTFTDVVLAAKLDTSSDGDGHA